VSIRELLVVWPQGETKGKRVFVSRLMIRKVGIRMEDRKMISKSKLWSFIFILISGGILLFPAIANAEDERARSCNHTFNRRSWFKFHRPLLKNYSNLPPQTFQEFCCR
jgi:hypothetical protein